MKADAASEFALWLQRANDPSTSEEERIECRARMDAYLRERMRAAFKLAAGAGVSTIKQDGTGD